MIRNNSNPNTAFSLAELSIVLIIIGLLVTGISAGSKLIESAKINSIITRTSQINDAFTTFKLTYDSLPGDMSNAQDFFGVSGITNGNGNGFIDWFSEGEDLVFQHLSAAGILPSPTNLVDVHPELDMIDQKWGIGVSSYSPWGKFPNKNRLHIHLYPYTGPTSSTPIRTSILYSIDKKVDDARPNTGIIMSTGMTASCTAGNTTCCTNNVNMHQGTFDAITLSNATYNIAVENECGYLFVELTVQN